jgi:hypothetical protein
MIELISVLSDVADGGESLYLAKLGGGSCDVGSRSCNNLVISYVLLPDVS